MAIACEFFWPNLSTSNYTNFQEYPRKIYITEPSFIPKKGYIPYWFPRAVENAFIAFPAEVAVSKLKKWNETLQKNI